MATISELNAQLDGAYQLTFESEIRFQQFLFAMVAYGPMKEITASLTLKTLIGNAQLAGTGVQLPDVNEVIANLKDQKAAWGVALLGRMAEAESKFPHLGSEHSVIIGRIKKAF